MKSSKRSTNQHDGNNSRLEDQLREAEKTIASQKGIINELRGYNTLLNRINRLLVFFLVAVICYSVYRTGGVKNLLKRKSAAVDIIGDSISSETELDFDGLGQGSSTGRITTRYEELDNRELENEDSQYEDSEPEIEVEVCDLLQHYDKKFGAGVYAGVNFKKKEWFQMMTGIPAPFANFEGTVLNDFIEGHNETFGLITLGYALVFNHVPEWEVCMSDVCSSKA
jgi:hypothetical protein